MKSHGISVIVTAILFLAPVGVGLAKDKNKGGAPSVKGSVLSVDTTAQTISIKPGKKAPSQEPKVFSLTSTTVIEVDGNPGKLADIKPKMKATVTASTDGKSAQKLSVKSPKSKSAGTAAAPKSE